MKKMFLVLLVSLLTQMTVFGQQQVVDLSTGLVGDADPNGTAATPFGTADDTWTMGGRPVFAANGGPTSANNPNCANWISPAVGGFANVPLNTLGGNYAYNSTFNTLNGCILNATLNLPFLCADDQVTGFTINNNNIALPVWPVGGPGLCLIGLVINVPVAFLNSNGALNTVTITVNNTNNTPTWLLVCGNITIDYAQPITNVNFLYNPNYCQGEDIIFTPIVTGGGAQDYIWEILSGGTVICSSGLINGNPAPYTIPVACLANMPCDRNYRARLTVRDNCGNSRRVANIFRLNCSPTVNAGADRTICEGQTVTLTPMFTAGATITWTGGVVSGTPFTPPVGVNTYTVTATRNGCTATDQVIVTVNPAPIVNAGADQSICSGTCATLTASGALTYTWTPAGGAANPVTVCPASTTTYTVTGTNANGCTDTDQVTVTVRPAPVVNAGADRTICEGQTVTLTPLFTAGATFTWTGGVVSGTPFTPPVGVNTYTVTATLNGCTATDQVVVTVLPKPTITVSATNSSICIGNCTQLTAGGGNGTYTWSPASGLSSTTGQVVFACPTTTTTYTVIGTGENGCTNTASITITVNPLPTVIASADITICPNADEAVEISATGAVDYVWTPTTAMTPSSGIGSPVSVLPTTTTTYTVTGTDANGCTATDEVIVTVENGPDCCKCEDGLAGINCWDTNGNRVNDPAEDCNNDGQWTSLDCMCGITSTGGLAGAHNGTSISTITPNWVSFGNDLGSTTGQLLSVREVPMNGGYILFTNNGTGGRFSSTWNRIGIGTNVAPVAKLDINVAANDESSTSLNINNSSSFGAANGVVLNVNGANSATNLGERITVSGSTGVNEGSIYTVTGGGQAIGMVLDVTGATSNNLGIRSSVDGGTTAISLNSTARNSQTTRAIDAFAENGTLENTAVRARAYNGVTNNVALEAEVTGNASVENVAVRAVSTSTSGAAPTQTGISALALNGTTRSLGINSLASGAGLNIGMYADAHSNFVGANNIGVFGRARLELNDINVGVLGILTNTDGPFLPAIAAGSYAGYFIGNVQVDGNIRMNGTATATGNWIDSDKRYKTNFKKLESTTDKIKKLNGYSYNMKTEEFKDKNFSKDEQLGLIAQEIKEVYPQLVKTDDKGYMAVNYDGMIPVLLEAIKEQNTKIETQQQQIDELNNLVKAMATGNETGSTKTTGQGVELSDKNVIVLDQNVPNPFAEHTVITYVVPANVQKAQIHFYNVNGVLIQSVDITERGNGKLNVFGENLTAGTYTYTLVADGKVITTKKMVKQ